MNNISFVCWDPDLIPPTVAEAANYQGPPEPITFKKITHDDRLAYFAGYTNASLGRVKNLYLDWARLKGPMSAQCQELNHLFSRCVDGNRIKVPPHLENLPKADIPLQGFILDVLHKVSEDYISTRRPVDSLNDLSANGVELFLSRDRIMLTEFDLFKMALSWCRKHCESVTEHLVYFDFSQMSDEQRFWVLGQLPVEEGIPELVINGLLQSSLLSRSEIRSCRLDLPRIKWKRIFDSTYDRIGRFMDVAGKALEMFHRKLIVLRVDTRLTVAIYIPKRIIKYQEAVVDDSVRLLAFPHSQEAAEIYRQTLPTKMDYRLYFNNLGLQLYEKQRANTWVFLTKPGQDDAPYRGIEAIGDRRRARQSTVEAELNSDLVASIALNKFSGGLAKHVGRVNRNPIIGAELYVISNRDTRSLQVLDQWLHYVDTQEVLPLFDKTEREYEEPSLKSVDWSSEPQYIRLIARDMQFSALNTLGTAKEFARVFTWLLEHGQRATLRKAFTHLLDSATILERSTSDAAIMNAMIDFLAVLPSLAITFTNIKDWRNLPISIQQIMCDRSNDILKALVTAANEMQILVVDPLRHVLTQITHMHLDTFIALVEHVSLVVSSSEIALDLLMGCLEQESARIFSARPSVVEFLIKNCIGIAMEHIEEASESRVVAKNLLELKRETDPQLAKARIRIDSHSSLRFANNDHVRLTAASLPVNSLSTAPYSMDALVEASEPGSVTFRCLHPLPVFLEDCSWKVKHCGSYVTTKTMFDALTRFIVSAEQTCLIQEKLLGIGESNEESSNPVEVTFSRRPDLNDSQNDAVIAALESDLACIWGPPGTGKTHTIAVLIETLLEDPERRLLITAPTHNAVDNVMRKYLDNMKTRNLPSRTALRVSTDVSAPYM